MNGIVLVASTSKAYFNSAVRLATSIKDYSDINITLFTHKTFLPDTYDIYKIVDNVVTDIPVNIRAKLWALSRTPYENTLYLDADMEVVSPEFSKVFNLQKDNDLVLTKIRPHVSKDVIISEETKDKLTYHGGFVMYNNKPETINLMKNWYDDFIEQQKNWNFPSHYNTNMQKWDQFTLWRLLKESEYKFKIGTPTNDYRWNYIWLYDHKGVNPKSKAEPKDPIIYHHTIPQELVYEKRLRFRTSTAEDID